MYTYIYTYTYTYIYIYISTAGMGPAFLAQVHDVLINCAAYQKVRGRDDLLCVRHVSSQSYPHTHPVLLSLALALALSLSLSLSLRLYVAYILIISMYI